jgi:hypothetical protein
MNKNIISGGCSFTLGNELSDDTLKKGLAPSNKTWAKGLCNLVEGNYFCTANYGIGNSAIARRIFDYISKNKTDMVVVMWTFISRYDWAMPRSKYLEDTRWASITPWDTKEKQSEVFKTLANSETQQEQYKLRRDQLDSTGVKQFADALYRYAANEYHEIFLSWKSIIWLQNILEKKNIKYFFTLADNTLFYNEMTPHNKMDPFMENLHKEINFTNWFSFGERMMGFNQWASLNDYPRGTTHPLDEAHKDAVQLMKDKFLQIYNKENK